MAVLQTLNGTHCGILTISSPTVSAATIVTDNNNQEVKEAREMLNSWSGQTVILEQVREKLARVLESNPEDYLALLEMARYQRKAGYINSRWVQYGKNKFQVGNYVPGTLEQAEATVRRAIRVNPNLADGYLSLAQIQIQQVKIDDASRTLFQAESIGTNDPWLHLFWAEVNNARGEKLAATQRWQRVLQSGTTDTQAQTSASSYLIDSYIKAGEHKKAVALYKDQIKRNPTNAWIRGNFADYLSKTLGRHDEAIEEAATALNIMNYGVGQRILAMALYRKWAVLAAQGKVVEGEKYYQAAFEILPRLDEVMAYGASEVNAELLTKALTANKGVSIDARNDSGSTALLIATNQNREQTVKFLLSLKADPNIHDNAGWTPLISAANEGNGKIVGMLLASGADIHATLQGFDAAYWADYAGYSDIASQLRIRAARK